MDRKTLQQVADAGIAFGANIRVPGGGRNILLKVDDLEDFVTDEVGFSARFFGVSKEQYLEWLRLDGAVQCSAKTKSGERCRHFVSGGGQMDIKDWLAKNGEYCAVHGGEPSAASSTMIIKRGRR